MIITIVKIPNFGFLLKLILHIIADLSLLADTIYFPFGLKFTEVTDLECPKKVMINL